MGKDKLMPGECMVVDEGAPVCNEDGNIVRKEVEDKTAPAPEELVDDSGPTFGDKIASIWNKTP